MERLTYRDKDGFPMMKKRGGFKQGGVERLAAYEDTRLTPEEVLPKDAVDEQPTIDAVEVVRCRDCKHRYSDSWCEYVDDDDNFYCARGKREEGAG